MSKPVIELIGKRVLVMGLGVHGGGLGVVRFLLEQGADVTVTDLRTSEQLASTLAQLEGSNVRFVLGEHRDEDFRNVDIVIRNPGVPRESRFLQIACEAGAVVEMEMTLFFRLCRGPIIGITGTKGKTTTTMLAAAMFKEQFPDTVVAGNMRISALEQLPKIGSETPVVLELSSWQLEGLGEAQLSPQYACFLNLSPDHLDRYGSMEAYAEAKAQIFLHQDQSGVVVLNWKDSWTSSMSERALTVRGPNDDGLVRERFEQNRIWFCEDDSWVDILEPHTIAFWQRDQLIWRRLQDGPDLDWNDELVCSKDDVQLIGTHNLANIAAAAGLAKAYGVENEHIKRAIQNFTGVPDRMEQVRVVDGVRYINDTTATAPAAAIAALHSVDAPAVVIAGGADKRLTFDEFARTLVQRAKAVVLLNGTATPKLQAALNAAVDSAAVDLPIIGPFDAFAPAVEAARELVVSGDIVLLSPGCASFGMFKNEFDRGEQFREIVRALPS